LLMDAGFVDIQIKIKEGAAEIIKDWMPGSGAEKVITSAYVTATKPADRTGFRDNVREGTSSADIPMPAPAPTPQDSDEPRIEEESESGPPKPTPVVEAGC